MHSFSYLSLLCLAIPSFFTVQASPGHSHGNVWPNHRSKNVVNQRDTSGVFTWYVAGLGACGATNSASDYIVALNSDQWDGGSHCFETVTLTSGGRQVTAQVTDQCPTCSYGQLDLTHDLFANLANGDPAQIGQISGSWSFGSASSSSSSQYTPSSTTVTPTSTSTSTPPPSTTSSSSSWSSTSSSTSSWSSASTTSSTTTSSSSSSSTSSTASATPTGLFFYAQKAAMQLGYVAANGYLKN